MPLDTSIPMQIAQVPQTQALNPMALYQMMQERQAGALRNQLVQQEMLKNNLAMQYAAEDRRIAEAARAQAAARVALERRQQEEFKRTVQSGYQQPKTAVMGPGTIQGDTPASYDYEGVKNRLIGSGNLSGFEAISKAQQQEAARKETEAKATGQGLTNKGLDLKNLTDEFKTTQTLLGSAGSPDAVIAIFNRQGDLIRRMGGDPEKSAQDFIGMLSNPAYGETPQDRFNNAVTHVSQSVAAMQKHVSDMATAETARNKPIEMDLGGKKILVDPVTLQPKAEFAKTLTPDEATKSGKTKDAKSSLDDTLARLDEEYTALSGLGAQPSEKENVVTNLGRRFTSSYIGQSLGVNPQAQTHIQNIEGLRNDVLLAIKNATGMSAKEMDSNVELQRQLAGATAPGQNIESVRRRLTDISRKYGLGKDFTKTEEKSANAASATEGGDRKIAKFSDIEHTAKVNNLSIEEVKKRVRAMGMTIEGE